MIGSGNESSGKNGFAALMPLYLSLYLVLLAMFILLSTFSTREDVRMTAVIGSINSAFPSSWFNPLDDDVLTQDNGDQNPAFIIQERLGDLFAQSIPVARYRVLQKARLMEATLPVEEIFLPDSSEFRSSSQSFLRRLAAILAEFSAGERLEMTIFAHTGKRDTPVPALTVERVGTFAQTMIQPGVPARSVLVAMEGGDESQIRLQFRVLSSPAASRKTEDTP